MLDIRTYEVEETLFVPKLTEKRAKNFLLSAYNLEKTNICAQDVTLEGILYKEEENRKAE